MMWPARAALMWSIIAASVVDLPEPVGPVTSTRPWCFVAVAALRRQPEFGSSSGSCAGIFRNAIELPPRLAVGVAPDACPGRAS